MLTAEIYIIFGCQKLVMKLLGCCSFAYKWLVLRLIYWGGGKII